MSDPTYHRDEDGLEHLSVTLVRSQDSVDALIEKLARESWLFRYAGVPVIETREPDGSINKRPGAFVHCTFTRHSEVKPCL